MLFLWKLHKNAIIYYKQFVNYADRIQYSGNGIIKERKEKGAVIMLELSLREEWFKGKLWLNEVRCLERGWDVLNTLSEQEMEEIKNTLKTRRRPHKRERICSDCDKLKKEERIGRFYVRWARDEFKEKMRWDRLGKTCQEKLNRMFDDLMKVETKEKDVESSFEEAVYKIIRYTKLSDLKITKALYKLYKEGNIGLDPLNDMTHNYLTVNKGRKIKNLLIYGDGDKFVGVVIQSSRIIEGKELEKEIC